MHDLTGYSSSTHAAEIIRSENEISRLSKPIHNQLAIREEAKNVLEVEDDVAVRFVRRRGGNVCFDTRNLQDLASRLTIVDAASETAG